MYAIRLDQGDYYQYRGGSDWGRCERWEATQFGSREEARAEIKRCGLRSFGARIASAY